MTQEHIGPLQKAILLKLSKSKNEIHVNELARLLKKSPVTVSISLKQLVQGKYVSTNEASRGKTKTLKLERNGIAALFAYCDVDPTAYYASMKQPLPDFIELIQRLFPENKDLRMQTCKNVYASILSDNWTLQNGDKILEKRIEPTDLSILLSLVEVARFYMLYSDEVVDKIAFNELLERLEKKTSDYVSIIRKDIA